MRLWLASLAAGTVLAATPAMARDGAWYVGGDFGAMIVDDTDFDVAGLDDVISVDHDYGYDAALFVGYDLGAFRLEAEAAYKKADLEAIDSIIALPGEVGTNFLLPPGGYDAGGGHTSALSFMINGMLDFGDDEGMNGFVGAGVGIGRVKYNSFRAFADARPLFEEDSDSRFAWQVFAGVRQAISDQVDVTVRYRFFNVSNLEMIAFNGEDSDSRFRSHSLLGGLTFNFGAPTPP